MPAASSPKNITRKPTVHIDRYLIDWGKQIERRLMRDDVTYRHGPWVEAEDVMEQP